MGYYEELQNNTANREKAKAYDSLIKREELRAVEQDAGNRAYDQGMNDAAAEIQARQNDMRGGLGLDPNTLDAVREAEFNRMQQETAPIPDEFNPSPVTPGVYDTPGAPPADYNYPTEMPPATPLEMVEAQNIALAQNSPASMSSQQIMAAMAQEGQSMA